MRRRGGGADYGIRMEPAQVATGNVRYDMNTAMAGLERGDVWTGLKIFSPSCLELNDLSPIIKIRTYLLGIYQAGRCSGFTAENSSLQRDQIAEEQKMKSSAFQTDPELLKRIHEEAGAALGKAFNETSAHNARILREREESKKSVGKRKGSTNRARAATG